MWRKYVLVYENRKLSPTETVLRMEGERIKEYDEGVNLTKTYCKIYCCTPSTIM
jgi:hypothetical protein